MSAEAAAAVVVVDYQSRQHVKHRSNQEVRAEEVFSYPRIPPNPHTHPTMTAIEFNWRKKKSKGESAEEFLKGMTEIDPSLRVDLHTDA